MLDNAGDFSMNYPVDYADSGVWCVVRSNLISNAFFFSFPCLFLTSSL